MHTAYTPIGRNIAYIKSCVSPCCINCTHANPCKLLWNQLKYTDIDVINNGNSIIELCNIRDGLLNICSLSHVEICILIDYFCLK